MPHKPPSCSSCIGCKWGNDFSRVTGAARIPLLIVGEASGEKEQQKGEPFVGASGRLLNDVLGMAGLRRDNYSITNILRCRPPGNLLKGQPYERDVIDHCKQYLDAVVAERKPSLILALGDIPLRELSTVQGSISELRGYILPSRYGIPVIGTYHPAFLMPRKGQPGAMHLLGVLMHDIRRAHQVATKGLPVPLPTSYILTPSHQDIWDYIQRLRSDPRLQAAYDIETEELVNPKPHIPKRIIQIQFSSAPGEAIVFGERHFDAAREIFALSNPKWDYNGRLFDRPILRRNGFTLNGDLHDLMELYGHLQSGFISNKDDVHGDKGVPSKLMSLQSCLSFYHPEFRPWKRVQFPTWTDGLLPLPVRLYGARDVDCTVRVGIRQFRSLEKLGLVQGYTTFKQRLGSEVLDLLTQHGLPIDRTAQTSLREFIEAEELKLLRELQSMVPEHLQVLHPATGYAHTSSRIPYKGEKVSIESIVSNGYDPACPPLIELSNSRGYLVQRTVTATVPNVIQIDCVTCEATGSVAGKLRPRKCSKCKGTGQCSLKNGTMQRDESRWGLSLFNPNSGSQVINFIKHMTITVGPPWYVPTHIDTGRDSANKAGMERLIELTQDPVLKLIERCKKLTKLTDYCSGAWVPGEDGRVHAEFRFGSANNQTSATNPPVQTYPKHYVKEDEWIKPIMRRIKGTIAAQPGHVLVEVDMTGFHARMQGWLAEDAAYYRIASLDCHSYVTAHYVETPDRNELLAMDDTALLKRLKVIMAEHEHERNYMVKRISFLNQYGGGAEKAATILRMPVVTVMAILDTIKKLFPKSFKEYPRRIKAQLQKSPRIVTAFGCARTFWDKDMQQAVAFSVANPAHCTIQDKLLRLKDSGALRKFEAVNFMHDALWLHPREELAHECVAVVQEELGRPSDILINSLGPFTCRTDAKMGPDMDSLEDVK